ncbi:hypothetical protein Tco_0883909 [Tanacetum coccineum]
MTSDHNRLELGIHDHSNEPSNSNLFPEVVPLAVKTATSRQELELLFHHHIAMLRTIGINPMIQPEPEDLPKDNPKLEIAVLSFRIMQSMSMLVKDIDRKWIDDKDRTKAPKKIVKDTFNVSESAQDRDVGLGEAVQNFAKKESMKKASRHVAGVGEVNPTHAYYNGSCTSKDTEDPSWSTSFKTRRTEKTSSALEALWKTLFVLYLYLIGSL